MRAVLWIGLLVLAVVTAASLVLWVQGGELAVGLFVAPLGLGFILAVVLTVVGVAYRRR